VVAHGDSGGPAFAYQYVVYGGPTYIYRETTAQARGTITAGRFTGTLCQRYSGEWVDGSYEVWYAPVLGPSGGAYIGSLQYYSATLLT